MTRTQHKRINNQSSFNFSELSEFLNSQLIHLPQKERQSRINHLYNLYRKHQAEFDTISNNPELVEEISAIATKHLSPAHKIQTNSNSFHKPSSVSLKLFGLLSLFLAVPATAQQINRFFAHSGTPSENKLCPGNTDACAEGYTTDNRAAFNPLLDSQYSRTINPMKNEPGESFAREQLRKCFDVEKLGGIVTKSRNQQSNNEVLGQCTTSSSPWKGWIVDVSATNIPTQNCLTLQSEIQLAINQCKDIPPLTKKEIAIVAGILAGLFLICCIGAFIPRKHSIYGP